MGRPGRRAPRRRRRWWQWWRRRALPRSRRAMGLGALAALAILLLLLLGLTRTRPGQEVPAFDRATTTTSTVPRPLPSITTPPTTARSPGRG